MNRLMTILVVAIACLLGASTQTQAETTIATDRVQVTVGSSGSVQIRTVGGVSLTQGLTPVQPLSSAGSANRRLGCYRQVHHQENVRSGTGTGDRVVSQTQTRSVVCP